MYKKIPVFIAACLGIFFFGISMITLGSILPQLTETFGLNQLEASALVVFLPIGILCGSLLFGPIVDRQGYKYLLIISSLLIVIGLEGLAFLQNVVWLRFAILSIGLGGGIINGLTSALVSDITNDSDRGAKLSLLGAFYGFGALGIPIVLAFLSKRYPYQTTLQYTGFFVLMCVGYFLAIGFPQSKQKQGFPLIAGIKLLQQPLLLLLCFALFFQSAAEGLSNNWTTSYLNDVSIMSKEQALFVLTCMVAGMTTARLLMSALFRKIGERRIFLGSLTIALTGALFLYFTRSYLGASIAMALIGFGLSSTFPVAFGILGRTYASLSGTVFSIALVIALIGNTLLNYLMGLVAKNWSIHYYPVVLFISMCMIVLLFALSLRHKPSDIK